MLERSIPGLFSISRKAATGKLSTFKVVADAFAANTFARAGIVTAIAGCEVFFFLALHGRLLSKIQFKHSTGYSNHGFFPIMKLRVDQKSFID